MSINKGIDFVLTLLDRMPKPAPTDAELIAQLQADVCRQSHTISALLDKIAELQDELAELAVEAVESQEVPCVHEWAVSTRVPKEWSCTKCRAVQRYVGG